MWIADKLAYRNQENFIRAYKGDELVWEKSHPDYLTFKANTAGSTVKMAAVGSPTNTPDLEYSTDGINWNTYTIGNTITLSNIDKYVQFRGDNDGFYSNASHYRFEMTGSIAASGSVMSLLDKTGDMVTMTAANDHCFYHMFEYCSSLISAPSLPATTLSNYCYLGMFQDCTSLTKAPALPATTMTKECYSRMFYRCTSLTTAPALPATTLTQYCYELMFNGCTALTSAPALPATALSTGCYFGMFRECTSLTTAPSLPATTLASSCYNTMFKGCTALTTAPALPATTLANYCYGGMFEDCTRLNHIKAMFLTTPGTSYTSRWVSGVASSGIFVKNSNATWDSSGVNSVPTNWTIQYE